MIGAIGGHGSDMLQMWREKLAAADADQSGGLSRDEFTKLGEEGKAEGAGPVGRAAPDPSELFTKLDADGDGELTTEEMEMAKPPPPPNGGLGGAAMSMLLGMQEEEDSEAADAIVSQLASSLVDAADTDGDGVVSAEEFAAQAADADQADSLFSTADANADGALSAEELASQLQQALQQRLEEGGRRAYADLLDQFGEALADRSTAETSA